MNTYDLMSSIGEHFAAGLFEYEQEAFIVRYSNALRRFWDRTKMPDYDGGRLYPCGVNTFNFDKSVTFRPHYSNVYEIKSKGLSEKSPEAYEIAMKLDSLVKKFSDSPHRVGGMGWTHSFPNYSRVLREGLDEYRARVEALPQGDFRRAMLILLEAIDIYHARCLRLLEDQGAPAELVCALRRMPYKPAESVYEAMVSLNFIYYIDGCDDIGPLDRILLPYYNGEDITLLLREFFLHVDANDGWSGTLGPDYNDITRMCLRAIHGIRRPSLQLLVRPDMPDWVWEESVASLATGCGQPAMYNYPRYMDAVARSMPEVPEADRSHLAFGGCTETMLEGMSNVGSDDAGINVALVFADYMREALPTSESYAQFFDGLVKAIRKATAETLDRLNEYRRTRALYRPAVVRTLLVDDCIDAQTEFNDGGARWIWSVINFAGVINVVDSLNAINALVFEEKRYSGDEFLHLLDGRDSELLSLCSACAKYGVDNDSADMTGHALVNELVDSLSQRECYPRGRFYAVSNQFTTYVNAGKAVGATPDGRAQGDPLCDSLGAINGNDTEGPTALLNSVSKLPLDRFVGTPITNIRLSKEHLPLYLKPLVKSFFDRGGMQLQVSCLSRADMLDAIEHPERHKSLIVRIGGYSEYFNRLSPELKQTVLARTEH